MKYLYHVRIGSPMSKRYSKIVYRTNNKQAAYRYAWSIVKKSGQYNAPYVFPNIFFKGKFEATLIAHESQRKG